MNIKRLLCFCLCFLLFPFSVLSASEGKESLSADKDAPTLTPAIAVISNDFCLIKSGATGNELTFSAEDFETALGCDKLKTVTITSLPERSLGYLMLGELEVMENQVVSRKNLSSLKFIPKSTGSISCSFGFETGKQESYSLTCNIFLLENENTSPVAENKERLDTYKNIAVFSEMSARDMENGSLSFEITKYPDKGILTLLGNCKYSYTPIKNYIGSDSFSYTAIDPYGGKSNECTVKIDISRSKNGTVFTDLIAKPCHYDAIRLSDLGIVFGKEVGDNLIFDKDSGISGAELITSMLMAAGIEPKSTGDGITVGSDLLVSASYRPYISTARELGLITGASFSDPSENATRAEAFSLVAGLLGLKEKPSVLPDLSDGEQIPIWAETAVYALLEREIIEAENGIIAPERELKREEALELLASVVSLREG